MAQQSFTTSLSPEVILEEIHGNLQVKGWERTEVLVKASGNNIHLLEKGPDIVRIQADSDCIVRLPNEATLKIGKVHGNARIKFLAGNLMGEQIHGSLVMRYIGKAKLDSVHGDLLAKQVLGDLSFEQVNGNAVIRDVQGDCSIGLVEGNLELRDVEGNLEITTAGNARAQLNLLAGDHYQIKANGNLHCRLAEINNARVELYSKASEILVKLPEERKILHEKQHNFVLGEGNVLLKLEADGNLSFVSQEIESFDMDDVEAEFAEAFAGFSEEFSQHITEQIESQLETHMEVLNNHMGKIHDSLSQAGLSQAEIDRIMQQARQSGEQATVRSQEKIRRAQEKLERKLATAQHKAELKARAAERRAQSQRKRTWSYDWTSPKEEPSTEKEVSSEERLIILRMLADKKISLDEAESLLNALEGDTE